MKNQVVNQAPLVKTFRDTALSTVQNVVAGGTATITLPVGPTYFGVTLVYAGVTSAQITDIEVRANGKPFQRFKNADRLVGINEYYGRGNQAGELEIYFERPEMVLHRDKRLFTAGTEDLQTFDIQFKIDAAATAPVVSAYALVEDITRPFGTVTKVFEYTQAATAAGRIDIDNIPRTGARIGAVHMFSAEITECDYQQDSTVIIEGTLARLQNRQINKGRAPMDDSLSLDFLLDGDARRAVKTANVQDHRVRPTVSGASTIDVSVEYFDQLAGL